MRLKKEQGRSRVPLRRGWCGALCMLAMASAGLAAAPVLRVEDVATGRYPELDLKVRLSLPPGSPTGEVETAQFTVHEFLGREEVKAEVLESVHLASESSSLRLVLLIDSTRSVPRRSFRRSIARARELSEALGHQDSVAVFSLNGQAHLRSDFQSGNGRTADVLGRIRRDGRVTRIYDSLETAIRKAREAQSPGAGGNPVSGGRVRSAVVLFTDGRDEGSSITWEDCTKLAELPGDMHIPVFVVLYGRRANQRQFARLSALTGGGLVRGLGRAQIQELPKQMAHSPMLARRLRVRSEVFSKRQLYPGDSVEVLVSWSRGAEQATARASYQISWDVFWRLALRSPVGMILLALLVIVLLGLVIATAILASRRSLASRGAASGSAAAGHTGTGVISSAAQAHAVAPGEFSPEEAVEPPSSLMATQMSLSAREAVARERFGFLRNHAYRMLQNALREAERYDRAQLVQVEAASGTSLREFDLFLERTVLGTGQWTDIRLADHAVAPVHARIRRVDDRFVIYDLSTGAPTYLNNRKLLRPRALHDGDVLRMGNSTFRFRGA